MISKVKNRPPWSGSREWDATERLIQCKAGTSFSSPHGGILQGKAGRTRLDPTGKWRNSILSAKLFPIRAMGNLMFQAQMARTFSVAVLPLMAHDEKLTVPLLMYTPPPCKHKAQNM